MFKSSDVNLENRTCLLFDETAYHLEEGSHKLYVFFSFLIPILVSSIAEADLTSGPSKKLLKNENKKVIVYMGIVVVVM
jgi:hypothetical protein